MGVFFYPPFGYKEMKSKYYKSLIIIFILFIGSNSFSQTVLNADGPGNTYELINSVFAPGYVAVETPDQTGGTHASFGRHIAEVFDNDLNKYVFEFYSHVAEDNDVTGGTVRQRVEMKTFGSSPANLKGVLGETVIYKWRFKIPVGFQPSSNFTHIHQVKAVDGDDGDPIFTLTPRKGSPNKLELIYVKDQNSSTDKKITVNLSLFEGIWVEATETIKIGINGTYSISVAKVSDGTSLLSYSNSDIQTIRSDNSYIRPKWGIYRSLATSSDLRDESIRFSDISIQEIPRRIILKLDDFSATNSASATTAALDYLITKKIKAGIGFITNRNDATALSVFSSYLNAKNLNSERLFEVWHHGFDHINPEFKGTSYAYQKQHFEDADLAIKNTFRFQMKSFGAPYNQVDATTNTVLSENSNYKVTMFNSPAPDVSTGILNLNNRVNMEISTGNPDYSYFLTNYNAYKASYTDYMVLQGHPAQWGTSQLTQFSQIIDFLISEGVEFITPYEYYLSLNPTVSIPGTSQTINFSSLPSKIKTDADFDAGATSTSGLIVTYNSSNPLVATIVNGKIHIVGVGTAIITASQMGNTTYKSADYVSQILTVSSIDFRSKSSGNWNTPGTWQIRATDGTWSTASSVPTASNNVYIQNGHTVTVDAADAYCYDLNINATTVSTAQGIVAINAAYNVNVNGKIRAYTGSAVTTSTDGSYTGTSIPTVVANMITTGSTGVLKFVGGTRNITNSNEWQGVGTTNNAEFALDIGAIGYLNTSIKFKTFTFTSGTISTNSILNVGSSSTPNGVLTIKNGAKLISSKTGSTSGSQVFTYSNSARCGIIAIDAGGILELTGASPAMDVTTFTNNGTVIYSGSVAQTLITKANDATSLSSFSYQDLVINNVAGVTALASTNNTGNSINAGGSITLTNGVLTVGNLNVPTGTISLTRTEGSLSSALAGIINVTYDGSSAITTGVECLSTITNLNLNNSAGVTLDASKTISSTFTITNGILNIPATAFLYVVSGNQIIGNFNNSNHIKTLSSGANTGALRLGSFSTSRTFPVGSVNYYLPITLTPVSNSDISVKVFEGVTSNATPNGTALSSNEKSDLVNCIYNITRSSGTGNYDLSLQWDQGLEGSNFSGFSNNQIAAFQYISNTYNAILGTGNNSSNTLLLTGLTSFAPIYIGKITTLPVSIVSFAAKDIGLGVKLNWKTASESNLSHYLIQRLTEGKVFETLTAIKANNTVGIYEYNYLDTHPISSDNYYKIIGVDFDGKITESNIEKVLVSSNNNISFYPNPLVDFISLNGLKTGEKVKIIDLVGKTISTTVNNGERNTTINLSQATSGSYILLIENEGKTIFSKTIIKK